jgi:hypothetical protein
VRACACVASKRKASWRGNNLAGYCGKIQGSLLLLQGGATACCDVVAGKAQLCRGEWRGVLGVRARYESAVVIAA